MGDLGFAHGVVVDVKHVERIRFFALVLVHADNHLSATVDRGLTLDGGGFDLGFGPASFDRGRHAAALFDFRNAFGIMRREHIAAQIARHVPELAAAML